jgi:hypothetical protein
MADNNEGSVLSPYDFPNAEGLTGGDPRPELLSRVFVMGRAGDGQLGLATFPQTRTYLIFVYSKPVGIHCLFVRSKSYLYDSSTCFLRMSIISLLLLITSWDVTK